MAKNFEHVIHKNSNVVNEGSPKLPLAENIEYGEIAVNYAAGSETVSLKNSNNDIITFLPDYKKESRMTIQNVASGTSTLSAEVGKYYVLNNVNTLDITLPVPNDGYVHNIVFYIIAGAAPQITITSTATIKYQEDYIIDANNIYEVSALYNGVAWVIAYMAIE